jgi:hemerythrin-like domain-containing protein
MCQHCGCHSNAVIRRLSDEHDAIVDALGDLRRAADTGDTTTVRRRAGRLADLLDPHTAAEENGLFRELDTDGEFTEHLATLTGDHADLDRRLDAIAHGDLAGVAEFVVRLRRHIDREENGLFPAAVIALDGAAWDRLTAADLRPINRAVGVDPQQPARQRTRSDGRIRTGNGWSSSSRSLPIACPIST